MTKKRFDWLDAARAVAMLLVVLSHKVAESEKWSYLYLFALEIVLFYAVSGYLFNPKKFKGVIDFLKYEAMHILLPYFVLSLLSFSNLFIIPILDRSIDIMPELKERILLTLQGQQLWFVGNLFIVHSLYCLYHLLSLKIASLIKKGSEECYNLVHIAVCIISALVGLLIVPDNGYHVWTWSGSFIFVLFLEMGRAYRYYEEQIDRLVNKCKFFFAPFFILIYGLVVFFSERAGIYEIISVHKSNYGPYPILSWLILALGTFAVFTLMKSIRLPKFLVKAGTQTLAIYALDGPVGWVMLNAVTVITHTDLPMGRSYTFIPALVIELAVCTVCIFIGMLFDRYIPWIVGKKKMKKTN